MTESSVVISNPTKTWVKTQLWSMLNVNCTVTGNTFLCTSSVQCERWVFSMNWISTGSHRGAFSTFTLFLNVASKLKIYIYIWCFWCWTWGFFGQKMSMAYLKQCFITYNLFCHFLIKFTIDSQNKEHAHNFV